MFALLILTLACPAPSEVFSVVAVAQDVAAPVADGGVGDAQRAAPLREVNVEAALAAHAAGILAERRAAFVAAYAESTAEGQAAARAVFAARAPLGAPALMSPPEHVLSAATRFARGDVAPGAPYPALVAIADSLDLRPVPGALAAGAACEVELVLSWIQAPALAGVPEVLALRLAIATPRAPAERTQENPAAYRVITLAGIEFDPRAFGFEGAMLPVTFPPLPAGEHFLAFELERDGHVVPGFFVPFEVVEGLDEALAARPLPFDSPLARLRRFGVRTEGRGTLADWVRAAPSPLEGAAHESAAVESAEDGHTPGSDIEGVSAPDGTAPSAGYEEGVPAPFAAWIGPPLGAEVTATLFVDVPPPSDPALWLDGPAGEPWRALGARGVRVVAVRFVSGDRAGPGTPLGMVSTWAAGERTVPRVLVCSGERLGALTSLLTERADVFQGLVFLGAPSQVALPGWRGEPRDGGPPGRRTLHVTCLAAADVDPPVSSATSGADDAGSGDAAGGALAPAFVGVRRSAPSPVVAAELPELAMRHLIGRLALPRPLPETPLPEAPLPERGPDAPRNEPQRARAPR